MEKKINFTSDGIHLEAMFNKLSASHGLLVTHPHPLYGGDMFNPVVESLVDIYKKKQYTTLRFNFRGVGGSEGKFGGGIDEQSDVLGGIEFLTSQGISSIDLVGYSFGSWVLAHMKELPEEVSARVFVSPPIAFMPFEDNLSIPKLKLVITGEEDEIAPMHLIKTALGTWNAGARFEVIDFADHFFFGSFPVLEKVVGNFLSCR